MNRTFLLQVGAAGLDILRDSSFVSERLYPLEEKREMARKELTNELRFLLREMVDYETLAAAYAPLIALVAVLVTLFFRLGKISNEQDNQSTRLAAIEEELRKVAPHSIMLEYLQRIMLKLGLGALPGSPESDDQVAMLAEQEEEKSND